MPDSRPDSGCSPFDQLDADELARTERFIDALAMCQPVEFGDDGDQGDREDQGDRALAGLLEDWRDELRSPSAGRSQLETCSELAVLEASEALNRGLAARRRVRRGLALVGSMAATVLGIGGFGVMVGDAQPGEALYGVHTMLFDELPSVHDDRIALSAKTDLDLVQQMITQGQWDQAQNKLAAVSDRVQTVNDYDRKQNLIDQVKSMNAKVVNRDPNATMSPSWSPNPDLGSLTGTTTPISGMTTDATASATTSDASATAMSPSPSTADLTASLSTTSPLLSSAAPAVSVTATPSAVPSVDPGNPTQQTGPAAS
jgi:hypothetical protein